MITPAKSQSTWRDARSGAKRVTNAMPMPDNAKVMGSSAGSALGANLRIAKCATKKDPNSPAGTPKVFNPSVEP